MISNPMTIANKCNEYFAHIGSTLADKIYAASHFNNYLNNSVETNVSFQTITENKVLIIINKIKNKIRYGYDSISNIMRYDPLNWPLTLQINQTLCTGIIPNALNISQIKPLFKQRNSLLFTNYRPIFIAINVQNI